MRDKKIMKLLLAIFSLFLFSCSNSTKEKEVVEYYENGNVKKECSNIGCLEYYEDGKLHKEYIIESGIPEGKVITFYRDGSKSEAFAKAGKLDGELLFYFPNGKINSIENYFEGVLVGQHQVFDSLGNLLKDSYVISIKKEEIDLRHEFLFNQTGDTIVNSKDIIDYRMPLDITLNEKSYLLINYKRPKLKYFMVVKSNADGFDKFFYIKKPELIDTLFYSKDQIINIPVSSNKKGENIIRGIVVNYDTVSTLKDSKIVLSHVDRYFEFYYNVN